MAATGQERPQRRTPAFCCGTPGSHCSGKKVTDHGSGATTHSSQDQVASCMRRYLLSQGYTQLTTRTFLPPVDKNGNQGSIVVLNKKAPRAKPGKVAGSYLAGCLKVRTSIPR